MIIILGILVVAMCTAGSYCFIIVEDWLKVLAPHLVLAICIEVINTALSSGCPGVALACNRCSRQYLDHGEYENWSHTTHLYAGSSHKRDITP